MTVRQLHIRPRSGASRLRLRAILAQSGLADIDPLKEDVFVQIRAVGGAADLLCAMVPASHFMRMHGKFMFWDHQHTVTSAKGIDDLSIKVRRDGSVRLKTHGRRVRMTAPKSGVLQITVGVRNAVIGDASDRCSQGMRKFP
jgi:hypothetical protein